MKQDTEVTMKELEILQTEICVSESGQSYSLKRL